MSTTNSLETARQAALRTQVIRQDCHLAYAPIILHADPNGLIWMTAADTERAKQIPVESILEFVDAPCSEGSLLEPLSLIGLLICLGWLFDLVLF